MIIRRLTELPPESTVSGETWVSRRLLLKADGMGFSLHDTVLHAGTTTHMEYVHHLEAVYCIEGEGSVEVAPTGARTAIAPGTVYALNQHDKHILRAETALRMVCVFNPPLVGHEVHDSSGAYPPSR